MVKHDAPALFRTFLARPAWEPEPVALSGVTDPYQPCERELGITRRCLEVAAACHQPVSIITKNALVLRDVDLLGPMAALGLVHVNVSVTTLDPDLARAMEPRASTPAARLRAVQELTAAGVPVRVLVAPVVPGLTDHEVPAILAAAKAAGAGAAGYNLLRLPLAVAPVFLDWLGRVYPDRREKVLGRIRSVRGGKLNDAEFGRRMTGDGELADLIGNLFRVSTRRNGLDGGLPPYDCTRFRPPPDRRGQGRRQLVGWSPSLASSSWGTPSDGTITPSVNDREASTMITRAVLSAPVFIHWPITVSSKPSGFQLIVRAFAIVAPRACYEPAGRNAANHCRCGDCGLLYTQTVPPQIIDVEQLKAGS
jgi:DNA repair photolyase